MARQARPHSAASVCNCMGKRTRQPKLSLSSRLFILFSGHRVERIEHPLVEAARLERDIRLALQSGLQVDLLAVCDYRLAGEPHIDAVDRLSAGDPRKLWRQLCGTHGRMSDARHH